MNLTALKRTLAPVRLHTDQLNTPRPSGVFSVVRFPSSVMYSKSSLQPCSVLCVDLWVNSWLKKVDDVTPVVSGGHGGIRFPWSPRQHGQWKSDFVLVQRPRQQRGLLSTRSYNHTGINPLEKRQREQCVHPQQQKIEQNVTQPHQQAFYFF